MSTNLLVTRAREAHDVLIVEGQSGTVLADRWGVSKQTVSLARRLGIALVEMGVDPDSREWLLISGKSGAMHWPVSDVIERRGSIEELHDALTVAFIDPWNSTHTRLRPIAEREALVRAAGGTRP